MRIDLYLGSRSDDFIVVIRAHLLISPVGHLSQEPLLRQENVDKLTGTEIARDNNPN
jgi:hypothetical protein